MELSDKTLQCVECGSSFVFTVGEQEFFNSRGFTNEPKRCSTCRISRRGQRGDRGGTERERSQVVCAECGTQTTVPFQPRGIRPVYCHDCYSKQQQA